MLVALRLSTRIRHLLKLDSVVLCAKNSRGLANKFSWKGKRPRDRYFPGPEELGDISLLHSNNVVAGNIPSLVKVCTKHINAYVEGRNLSEAEKVFDLMITKGVQPNAYTYTALMKGYSLVGNTERVCELLKEMEEKGVEPTVVTFSVAIQSYTIDGDVEGALCLFNQIKNSARSKPNAYTYNSLLKVCVIARDLGTARNLFDKMNFSDTKQNKIAMNTMIDVYAECCNEKNGKQYLEECRELIEEMERKGTWANERTYSTLLKLCSRGNLTSDSMTILNKVRRKQMRLSVFSYSTILDGLAKDQNLSNEEVLELSSQIVNEMKIGEVRLDATSYTSLVNVALRVGDLCQAERMFKEMKTLKINPDNVTYGFMIKCYEKLGDPKNGDAYLKPCLDLWQECEKTGMKLTEDGYTSLLSACANAANLDEALTIWKKMISNGIKPDVVIYTAMINACLKKDTEARAFNLLSEMKTSGVKPNAITYGTFLSYFLRKKDRSGGEKICNEMKAHGVKPDKVVLRMLKALGIE